MAVFDFPLPSPPHRFAFWEGAKTEQTSAYLLKKKPPLQKRSDGEGVGGEVTAPAPLPH